MVQYYYNYLFNNLSHFVRLWPGPSVSMMLWHVMTDHRIVTGKGNYITHTACPAARDLKTWELHKHSQAELKEDVVLTGII